MSWFNTIEFYVIAGTLAAAAVALASIPGRRGEGRQHLVGGTLGTSGNTTPGIECHVDENRRLHLRRTGLPRGVTDRGAVSLAVNVAGFDVVIEERITFDRRGTEEVDTADFVLDFLGPERYHIRYNSEPTSCFTAFTLPIREGISLRRDFLAP